ncbi:MAG: hypothetical protein GX051_05350, partial [Clostridiales bacterium]|nr:hypothetical protein [Clostridiales bacterium]
MKYWVLDGSEYKAEIKAGKEKLILSNGLVKRVILLDGCKTESLFNITKNIELVDGAYPDFAVSANGNKYLSDNGFAFAGIKIVPCCERVEFKPSETMTAPCVYPPDGKAAVLEYVNERLSLGVSVRYEIYDGAPVIMKLVRVKNLFDADVCIDNIYTDVLKITGNRDTLFVDSDFDSTTDFLGLELSEYAKNYARFHYDFLEVAPLYRMNVALSPEQSVSSITAFELLLSTDYYEQRLTEVKAMYRLVAPWCTDNVLFFHLISNSSAAIKKATNQCAEIGLEMIIQSFGSGVNMESGNEKYLSRIKSAYDYAHKNGLRIGAYTLAYVKNYRPVKGDEALNHDGSGICRCLSTDWSEQYMKDVIF